MKILICLFLLSISNAYANRSAICSSKDTSRVFEFDLTKKVPTLSIDYKVPMKCVRLPIAMVSKGATPAIVNCTLRHGPDGSSAITLYAQSSESRKQFAIEQPKGPTGFGRQVVYNCI